MPAAPSLFAHFCGRRGSLWSGPFSIRAADYRLSWLRGRRIYMESVMVFQARSTVALAGLILGGSIAMADTLQTHRIPAALAVEAANETVGACAKQGYRETAVVLDADG